MAAAFTVFLLSPASCAGTRARMLLKSRTSPLTARLANGGAPIGEVLPFLFPPTSAGGGDMSGGGLMLRCARTGTSLDSVRVRGAARHGPKPPKLGPAPY